MKRYGRKSGKRWSAKARRAEDRAIRQGAHAAFCKRCNELRLLRDPAYDFVWCATFGRCSMCGKRLVQTDFDAAFRAVLYGRIISTEPSDTHWLERVESTDFDVLTFDDSPPPDS